MLVIEVDTGISKVDQVFVFKELTVKKLSEHSQDILFLYVFTFLKN